MQLLLAYQSPQTHRQIKGDKISKINGKEAAAFSYQKLKSSFEKDGGSVTVEIIRDGKTITVRLKLERII